jgi:hypothetical protein
VRREHLDHLLRAASQIIGERDLLVVGSQSVLGTWDEDALPPAVVLSIEADLAPLDDPDESKSQPRSQPASARARSSTAPSATTRTAWT